MAANTGWTTGDDEARWRAVMARDVRADGQFYFGVKTTGVYCRPSCPARRPQRHNVVFFDDVASAEAAGFRPCKRCAPHRVSEHTLLAVRVLELLHERENPPTLKEMAAALQISPHHLQRTFKRITGLSPHAAAAALRAERFEHALRQRPTVTEAMLEAGYGSSRALYERVRKELAMSPSAYRRGGDGVRIQFTVADSSLGPMLVAKTAHGICALWWGGEEGLLALLRERFPRAQLVRDDAVLAPLVEQIEAWLSRHGPLPDVAVDPHGTRFQRRVWDALREIPVGETRTYKEIAAAIGQPRAARAVAQACAANPVALFIPCHRVIRSDGNMSGYRWGVERKEALLAREQ